MSKGQGKKTARMPATRFPKMQKQMRKQRVAARLLQQKARGKSQH